jgi:SOUL heme-binding protein
LPVYSLPLGNERRSSRGREQHCRLSVSLPAEEPKCTLVRAEKPFSIRDCPPLLLAEVTVGGSRGEAANAAFQILAGFVFSKNVKPGRLSAFSLTPCSSPDFPSARLADRGGSLMENGFAG